eukprot:1285688-Alexandrium_andersonii.AAC.1
MCEIEGRLGGGPKDLQEVKLLGRIARRAPDELLYEADPRRAEQLFRDLLKSESSGVRGVSCPRAPAIGATWRQSRPPSPS